MIAQGRPVHFRLDERGTVAFVTPSVRLDLTADEFKKLGTAAGLDSIVRGVINRPAETRFEQATVRRIAKGVCCGQIRKESIGQSS